jgi:hypothetical protein
MGLCLVPLKRLSSAILGLSFVIEIPEFTKPCSGHGEFGGEGRKQ